MKLKVIDTTFLLKELMETPTDILVDNTLSTLSSDEEKIINNIITSNINAPVTITITIEVPDEY